MPPASAEVYMQRSLTSGLPSRATPPSAVTRRPGSRPNKATPRSVTVRHYIVSNQHKSLISIIRSLLEFL